MKSLNYNVLKETGYDGYILEQAPVKILQFGEGNFLRAFVDYWFDMANEKAGYNGKAVLVQPIAMGLTKMLNAQQGLYTLYLRGSQKGEKVDDKRVISMVDSCLNPYEKLDYDRMMEIAASEDLEIVVSNTTEAGITYDSSCLKEECPPTSFPAKLTQVLYTRWQAGGKGLVILSCELIDNNGKELLRCVNQYIDQWELEQEFKTWVSEQNTFCSTLVDRIVPGRINDPKEVDALEQENGYHDDLIDVGECFGVWIIEGPKELEVFLPFKKAGVNVHVVPDVTPYKKRKVRILNGAHTGVVLGAYLAGFDIVRDCMHDETIKGFMNKMLYEEIIPTLSMDKKDLTDFAAAVEDRFNNPFVNHELLSISLNSTSKWKARNMPSFLKYIETQEKLPQCLTMSLAAYIAFYSCDIQSLSDQGMVCKRPAGNEYTIHDDAWVLEFYHAHKNDSTEKLVHSVLSNIQMWDQDLTKIVGLEKQVLADVNKIREYGAGAAYASCL